VRAGYVEVNPDSFEKDGKQLVFERAFATREGLGAAPSKLAAVRLKEGAASAGAPSKKGKAAKKPTRATSEAPVDAATVARLKAWRRDGSLRKGIPAVPDPHRPEPPRPRPRRAAYGGRSRGGVGARAQDHQGVWQ